MPIAIAQGKAQLENEDIISMQNGFDDHLSGWTPIIVR